MNQTESQDSNPKQSLEAAQLEKLNLEILALKKKSAWRDTLLQLLPAVTVLLALTGFLYGIYQSSKSEQKARIAEQTIQKIRIQDQIRSDLDEIVRFPTDKKQTVSRISFLLTDLDKLINTKLGDVEAVPKEERRRASDVLAHLISDDTDLNERRNVDVAVAMLTFWDDYSAYLESNPKNLLMNILTNHYDALEELRKKAPGYFSRLKYLDQTKTAFDEPNGVPVPNHTNLRHFEDLITSYSEYLSLVKDPNERQAVIRNFQIATCNRDLTQQKFGQSFDPKKDPSSFSDCAKK